MKFYLFLFFYSSFASVNQVYFVNELLKAFLDPHSIFMMPVIFNNYKTMDTTENLLTGPEAYQQALKEVYRFWY